MSNTINPAGLMGSMGAVRAEAVKADEAMRDAMNRTFGNGVDAAHSELGAVSDDLAGLEKRLYTRASDFEKHFERIFGPQPVGQDVGGEHNASMPSGSLAEIKATIARLHTLADWFDNHAAKLGSL